MRVRSNVNVGVGKVFVVRKGERMWVDDEEMEEVNYIKVTEWKMREGMGTLSNF